MANFYLGIDVSKGYADFVLLGHNKKVVISNFQLDDTFDGHANLYELLNDFFNQHPGALVFAAAESTGGYENNWLAALHKFAADFDIKAAKVNPFAVSASSKAGLNRITTDPISARNIAEYLITHPENVCYSYKDEFASHRKMWTFIRMLVKQKTQLLNQLESLLYLANPEMLIFCKHKMPKWLLLLLEKYPTAKRLNSARLTSLIKIPYVNQEKATQIKKLAADSVASIDDDICANTITTTVNQILILTHSITQQVKLITEQNSMPELELIKSFKGIDDFTGLGLLMEIGNIERFPDAKHLVSFFGLHPVFKTSGDGKSGFKMSKKGRRVPRHLLFIVALVAIRSNPLIREIYNRKLDQGMSKMAAIGLCMHKILRIVYGMLKHKKLFDENIDRRNQARVSPKKVKKYSKNRRFQRFDNKAPISARQSKKRKTQLIGIDTKEQAAPQNGLAIECGVDKPVPSSLED